MLPLAAFKSEMLSGVQQPAPRFFSLTLLHAWLRHVPHSYKGFHAYSINVLQTAQSASVVDVGGTLASHIGRRERDVGWQWQQGQARLLGGIGAPQC